MKNPNVQQKFAVAHGRGKLSTTGGKVGSKKAAAMRGKRGTETPTQRRARAAASKRPQTTRADKVCQDLE